MAGDAVTRHGMPEAPGRPEGGAVAWHLAGYTHRPLQAHSRPRLDLNGLWAFRTDPDDQGMERDDWRGEGEPAEGETPWSRMRVPAHWQVEGLQYQGVAWYSRRFPPYRVKEGARLFLVFEGVDYSARVWVNGVEVGSHEGGYFGFEFDVTDVVSADHDNVVVVRVDCPMNSHPEAKRVVKGAISHWDCIPIRQAPLPGFTDDPWYPHPILNPAGIWAPVYLEERPPVHIRAVTVTASLLGGDQVAEVKARVRVRNSTATAQPVVLRVRIAPANFDDPVVVEARRPATLQPGEDEVELTLLLQQPRLWWSWDHGFPHLYRLEAWLHDGSRPVDPSGGPGGERASAGDGVWDGVSTRFGIREIRRGPNWEIYLNGRRIFLRGTNYLSRLFMSTATPELYDRHLAMVRELGMNLIRVFAHVELPYFYERCDELGILVYQDLPFQWGYEPSPEVRATALDLTDQVITALRNHPSIVIWCCHSEPRLHDW
ncbi:MAG TPA: sugar-binding domain-containing protein, partial [Limnochordales bacterium]